MTSKDKSKEDGSPWTCMFKTRLINEALKSMMRKQNGYMGKNLTHLD